MGVNRMSDLISRQAVPDMATTSNEESHMNIEINPFSWNDNFSEIALEDFQQIQKVTCQSIGMALAKLEILEKTRL